MTISILGFSVPTFWVGLILILTFAVALGWLPAGGRGPTVAVFGIEWSFLTLERLEAPRACRRSTSRCSSSRMMVRLSRAGTRELMLTDTVKFARAAGLSDATILRRHVLKLISIPIVTVFGLEFGSTLAFAVVTETIFSWPGVGKLIIDSINSLDRPGDGRLPRAGRGAVRHDQRRRSTSSTRCSIRGCGRERAHERAPRLRWRAVWREFRENRVAVVALARRAGHRGRGAARAAGSRRRTPTTSPISSLMDARRPPGFVGSDGYVHCARHRRATAATCSPPFSTACASRCRWA